MTNLGGIEISEADFPALYHAADQNSLKGQARFLRATRVRLILLVVAAFSGAFTLLIDDTDLAGVIAAGSFAGALLAEVFLLRTRPERVWYDGRAAAESAKTLTWRYLVGGAPFPVDSERSIREIDELFLERLQDVRKDVPGLHLVPVKEQAQQITPKMREVRERPLDKRRGLYAQARIGDQATWYTDRAAINRQRATGWSVGMVIIEAIGLTGAVLKATNLLQIDLLGFAGALIAASAAWVQTKQHEVLARAYATASHELADISSRIDGPEDEEQWGDFVAEAEEAISREHVLWQASRDE